MIWLAGAQPRPEGPTGSVLPDRCGCNLRREVLRANPLARTAERHEALDLVTKLTDIARPPMLREQLERVGRQKHVRLAKPLRRLAHEKAREVRYLFAPFAKRRNQNPNDRQPIVQVLSEFAFGHALFEIRIRRGNHAHVDALRACFAERHDFALLEEAQQLRLHVERQVADFVEEQRAACGRSNETQLIVDRAGEAARR